MFLSFAFFFWFNMQGRNKFFFFLMNNTFTFVLFNLIYINNRAR